MAELIPVKTKDDILPQYRGTPLGLLLEYHNLGRPYDVYEKAQLLVGMCIDNRKHLHIPDNFSFIIRAGGANMQHSEFKISFAIGVGGVSHMALIGHNNCGMVNLASRREEFINGLIENAGWERKRAEEHFERHAPQSEIGNEREFVLSETMRLRSKYPKIMIAPMLYLVEDYKLYLVKEN